MASSGKPLVKMRKLSAKEMGPFRLNLVSMLACSSDPTAFLKYMMEIEPCRRMAQKVSAASKKK